MTTSETEIEDESQPPPANDAEEIQRLRKTKDSLHQTAQTRKARIAELETEVESLKAQLSDANKKVESVTIGVPMRALAREISTVPTLFEREFLSRFSLVEKDATLVVADLDRKPLEVSGAPVAFTSNAVSKLLSSDVVSAEDRQMFAAILIGSRASGSGATGANRGGGHGHAMTVNNAPKKPVDAGAAFGLR